MIRYLFTKETTSKVSAPVHQTYKSYGNRRRVATLQTM